MGPEETEQMEVLRALTQLLAAAAGGPASRAMAAPAQAAVKVVAQAKRRVA